MQTKIEKFGGFKRPIAYLSLSGLFIIVAFGATACGLVMADPFRLSARGLTYAIVCFALMPYLIFSAIKYARSVIIDRAVYRVGNRLIFDGPKGCSVYFGNFTRVDLEKIRGTEYFIFRSGERVLRKISTSLVASPAAVAKKINDTAFAQTSA